ncbi:hypothetical protein JW879_03450 [candidate division WOR-3 bacterium]|nr:hypothetical protein [candidate division WOR-3 bacterium]
MEGVNSFMNVVGLIVGGFIALLILIFIPLLIYAFIESRKKSLRRMCEAKEKYSIGQVVIFRKNKDDILSFKEEDIDKLYKGYIAGFRETLPNSGYPWELRIVNIDGEELRIPLENIEKVIGLISLNRISPLDEEEDIADFEDFGV